MSTTKAWIGKRNMEKRYTRVYGNSWFDVYHELEEKGIVSYYEYIPYEKALADKNNIDWEDYFECLGESVCDIYEYAKQIGMKIVGLTEDELKSLIYDETIHEYDCEMLEYKYSHEETDRFHTLEEIKEKLAEYID